MVEPEREKKWESIEIVSFKNIFPERIYYFLYYSKENVTHFNIKWRCFLSEVWIYGGVADARAATIAVIVQLAAELGA